VSLYHEGRRNIAVRGRLYLAARGIEESPEALAGAMLEGEFHAAVVAFLSPK
jgi:hypothetical protein